MSSLGRRPKPEQARTEYIQVRFRPDEVEAIREFAAANDRSISQEVRRALKAHMKKERESVGTPAPQVRAGTRHGKR